MVDLALSLTIIRRHVGFSFPWVGSLHVSKYALQVLVGALAIEFALYSLVVATGYCEIGTR
jgi:hypothetical protein